MNRWQTLALLLAGGVALGLRCPRLDLRPMHNDESVNAIKFGKLWEQGEYKYDPNEYHGPTLSYATVAFSRLTGAPDFDHFTEARLRLVTVAFGIGLVLLLPLIADGLGNRATVWAAFFTAVSPAMVFYSRYYIHEMLLVFFTFLGMAASWRYWRSHKVGWALLAGAGVGLMSATKETFPITLAAGALALGLNQIWNRRLDASGVPVKAQPVLLRHLAGAAGIWLAVVVVLFSSFFTNAGGLLDSVRAYSHWSSHAGPASPHIHPWYFYLRRLIYFHAPKGPIWSEALILVLCVIGASTGFARKHLDGGNASFIRFLAFYTFALMAAYSLISYKTPWCLLNFWHGMILLAGVGAAVLSASVRKPVVRIALAVLLLAGAGQLAAQAWEGACARGEDGRSLASDPRNPYVYAQTVPDILRLVKMVDGFGKISPAGHRVLIKVMAPHGDFWPLPWYLRSFQQVGWWDELPTDPFAPIIIVSADFHAALDEKKMHLMVGLFEMRPQVFFELYVEKSLWESYLQKQPVPQGTNKND